MIKRYLVTGTYAMFVNASDVDNAREIALANAEKAFENDYDGNAFLVLDGTEVEYFRELSPEGN